MSEFLSSLGCSTVDLMNDHIHILRGHHCRSTLSRFFRDKLPKCTRVSRQGKRECRCINRLRQTREVYSLPLQQRRALCLLDGHRLADGSMDEIREINVQHHLDVMHSCFVHNATSDGVKFISILDDHGNGKHPRSHPMFHEFGVYLDYWKQNRRDFCRPKFADLKAELLNNTLHPVTACDFQCISRRAHNWMSTDLVRSMTAQREFDAMRGAVHFGEGITIHHIVSIVTYTNYKELAARFRKSCLRRHRKEDRKLVMQRNAEIANWCRLLRESVYHFGGALGDDDTLYHGIGRQWMFQRVATKFNVPMSTSTSRHVASRWMNGVNGLNAVNEGEGVCLALGKMWSLEENNLLLDVSAFSDYPNEREQVLYGGRLGFVDLIYNGISHGDEVMALRLFQKMIDGDWFSLNRDLFQRKHQQGVLQLMRTMRQAIIEGRFRLW